MSLVTKPMLAASGTLTFEDLPKLKYPVYASPKLDGIRCLIVGGKAISRNFKPITNDHIRTWLEKNCPSGLDGELLIPGGNFQDCQSGIMSVDGKPTFTYNVFEYVPGELTGSLSGRLNNLRRVYPEDTDIIKVVPQTLVQNAAQLTSLVEKFLSEGHEGCMVRSINSPYKCGRATTKEGWLLRFKVFVDAEAEIVGFEEQMTNTNKASVNELGHTHRSSHQDGMVPKGTLGKILVVDIKDGWKFAIGTGFDDALRQKIWNNKENYIGKIVTYKFMPFGMKDVPRLPVFKGFRHKSDMSE